MESWLIPAAPVTVVEEIKKSRFITMLAHTDGVEAAKAYGGGVNQALRQLTTQRKTPLTEYTLQCEYSQLTGIEALLGQCDGKIINSDYQAFVLLRVALPAAKVAEFSAKLADFSRGSLQLLAIEE
ncbi:TPA: DUF1949 domain-containing protein [Escherichia coli]|nr:DUF1949 domain-containing protein [Escherichia coli]